MHVRTFQAVFIDERIEKIWKGFLIVRISVKIQNISNFDRIF